MQRISLISLIALLSTTLLSAQNIQQDNSGNDTFSIKSQVFMGGYISPSSNIKDIDPNAPAGLNIGIEFPSTRQHPWQQYLNDPTVGLGIAYLNLGNDVMGSGIAMYPYILLNAFRKEHFHLNLKLASGLVAVNGHYKATVNEEIPNKTFGSAINAYLSGGLNIDFPITRNLKINSELGFIHVSNGRLVEPNKGVNILYGGVGFVSTINSGEDRREEAIRFPDLPYKWSLNITGAAGAQNADLSDKRKFFISTFHIGGIYNVSDWYGVGLGADVFYNDAIGNETNRELFCKEHDYSTKDKIRVGLALNNELQFGDVTAMVDWGLYLLNPSRHFYSRDHEEYGHDSRLPLLYKTKGAGSQEACHYIRFGVKYRVWDNLYIQALAKTHRHIAEYIEFGIGYQIPFLKKQNRKEGKSVIFHYRKNWWKDF